MELYHKTREWHSRDKGGPYVLQNLRSFCAAHDSRTKTF